MSKKNDSSSDRPMTVPRFVKKKQAGTKLTMLTAYDFPTAKLLDEAGVDALLVGDSLAMVVQGRETTLPVTLDEMIYHGEMVARAAKRALVVVDIPFPINHHGVRATVKAAGKIMKQTGCNAVKLEGGAEQAEVIEALVTAGIPVIAHVGLRPQAVNVMGGYKVQRDRDSLMADAIAAEKAGAAHHPDNRNRRWGRLRRTGPGRQRHAGRNKRLRSKFCKRICQCRRNDFQSRLAMGGRCGCR